MDSQEYWKNYRKQITKQLKEEKYYDKKDKQSIIEMAIKIGIKPTARIFNISPSSVRYYLKKDKE